MELKQLLPAPASPLGITESLEAPKQPHGLSLPVLALLENPGQFRSSRTLPALGWRGVLPQAEPMAAAHPTHPPRAWGRNFKVFYVISLKPEYKMQKLMLCSKHQERSLSQPGAKLQCGLSLAEAEVKPGLCCQILGGEDGSEVMAA